MYCCKESFSYSFYLYEHEGYYVCVESEHNVTYFVCIRKHLLYSRLQSVGQNGHMALLGHCLTAYLSMLNKDGFRKLTTRILSDTTLWLCRLFRFVPGMFCFCSVCMS